MKIGAVYPHLEIGPDPGAIKEWTQGIEAMGFDYILTWDHVIGAGRTTRPDWKGSYDIDDMFQEPFVLLSFMAGLTSTIELSTGILILAQRQTVLAAKQAACVDVLCKGRLRLGIGTGWNPVEYETLGVDWAQRGKIFEDQIGVLRDLWTKPAVTIKTPLHTVTDAGLNPLPVQRPIPLWFGGGGGMNSLLHTPNKGVETVVRRIARFADGWMLACKPDDAGRALMAQFEGYCREYGRDPSKIGREIIISPKLQDKDGWADLGKAWQNFGVGHIAINTIRDGLTGPEQHLRRIEDIRKAMPKQASSRA